MPHPILPMPLYYDGTFQGPTVPGGAGSTSGAADSVTVGDPGRWIDIVGRWEVDTIETYSGLFGFWDHITANFLAFADFPYCPLVRPASESYADQRVVVTDDESFFGYVMDDFLTWKPCVLLRYRDSAAYIPLAFYLVEFRTAVPANPLVEPSAFGRITILACRSGMADVVILDEDLPAGVLTVLPVDSVMRLDCSAIRFWPTRLFVTVTNVGTGEVIFDRVIEDSTPELQQAGVSGLGNRIIDRDRGPDLNFSESHGYYTLLAGSGYYTRIQLYGSNQWQNQPVIVFFNRADAGNQAGAQIVYSATADLPRCRSKIVFRALAELPRCNASIIFRATASASDSVVLPHIYSRTASISLVFTASSSCTAIPGRRVTAHASLVFTAASSCRTRHRFASATVRYHATAIEHATIRPVHSVAPLLYRARARLRRPAVPAVPASLTGPGYLGRFQVGTDFAVPVLAAKLPVAEPSVRVYNLAPGPYGRPRFLEILGLAPTRHPLVFVLGVTLGALYHPGRYVLVYNGLPGAAPAVFEVVSGGDQAGAVIAAHALEFSAGPRLVAQLDSGMLLVGARPDLA